MAIPNGSKVCAYTLASARPSSDVGSLAAPRAGCVGTTTQVSNTGGPPSPPPYSSWTSAEVHSADVHELYGGGDGGPPVFDTCVVVPTHPARGAAKDPTSLLGRALASVYAQTLLPFGIAIALDTDRSGAAKTRQAALDEALKMGTEFVSFLD